MYVSIFLKVLKILSKMRPKLWKNILHSPCAFKRHLDYHGYDTGMLYRRFFGVNLEQCSAITCSSSMVRVENFF